MGKGNGQSLTADHGSLTIPMKTKRPNSKGAAAYVVEYQAFNAEKRSFGWKELVRYKTRKLADMVVRINRRKCELRVRKLMPQNSAGLPGAVTVSKDEWLKLNSATPEMPTSITDRMALCPGTSVKTRLKSGEYPLLCGRVHRNDAQECVVIGYRWDDSDDKLYIWRGTKAEFTANWTID